MKKTFKKLISGAITVVMAGALTIGMATLVSATEKEYVYTNTPAENTSNYIPHVICKGSY